MGQVLLLNLIIGELESGLEPFDIRMGQAQIEEVVGLTSENDGSSDLSMEVGL